MPGIIPRHFHLSFLEFGFCAILSWKPSMTGGVLQMASKEDIRKRITMLRQEMKKAGADYYYLTSTDPHISEYTGDHFKTTEYLSGCTSDNVVLIVDEESAHLWTDGRYFISAALELSDTGISLMRDGQTGVPSVHEYLRDHLEKGQVLAFDGTCVKASEGAALRKIAKKKGASCEGREDLISSLWIDRPPLPSHPVLVLDQEIAGKGVYGKVSEVRDQMEKAGAHYFALSRLDDIMWLFNLRGGDVECNPVALSHALIGTETIDLFIQKSEVTDELASHARENRIKIHEYGDILNYLKGYHFDGPVLCDSGNICDAIYSILEERSEIVDMTNPTELMKAIKNETEQANSEKFYLLDSAAVCRFIFRVQKRIKEETLTECDAASMMDNLRREIPGFLDLSFPTISAYNANAAMAHYQASPESCSKIKPEGFLLVDSGGQYMGATTDVTRTIALGPVSDEMKKDFTLVAISNLSLLFARFAKGTTGCQLDMIAREPLFRYGRDYNHGTGHGVGYILNVHEGPQRFSHTPKNHADAEVVPGMITSDEPGIYRENRYGIRTESIVLCVPDTRTEFGEFYRFRPLTYVPIDLNAIDESLLQPRDRENLNEYHRMVREKISPLLDGEELEWLIHATREI